MNPYDFLPFLIAFVVTTALGPVLIPFLRRKKAGQTEREELESHQVKTGTPTMGGLMFLIAIVVVGIIYCPTHAESLPVLLVTVGFGMIGFFDDYLKVILKRTDGLLAWQKMLLQIVVTTAFLIYLVLKTDILTGIIIPFTGATVFTISPFIAIPLFYLCVLGTVNGVNFTDGLDGLASCVTIVVSIFLTLCALLLDVDVTPITMAVFGGLTAFLLFNCYPAKIFMGDTGSLALGGFVAATAYMLRMPLFIIIVGLIYLVEVLSVILQVGYFKMTHGKRIFRMAPIHHHFELGGWSEIKVVSVFSIVTLLLAMFAWVALIV